MEESQDRGQGYGKSEAQPDGRMKYRLLEHEEKLSADPDLREVGSEALHRYVRNYGACGHELSGRVHAHAYGLNARGLQSILLITPLSE